MSFVFECFDSILALAERSKGSNLEWIQADGGGEFTVINFFQFLRQNGKTERTSCAYAPQENGIAEWLNRMIVDIVRPLLKEHNVSKEIGLTPMWLNCILKNRVACRRFSADTTPYKVWHDAKLDVSHVWTFGSNFCYHIRMKVSNKLGGKGRFAIKIGWSTTRKPYNLWDEALVKVVISRDERFEESCSNKNITDASLLEPTSRRVFKIRHYHTKVPRRIKKMVKPLLLMVEQLQLVWLLESQFQWRCNLSHQLQNLWAALNIQMTSHSIDLFVSKKWPRE